VRNATGPRRAAGGAPATGIRDGVALAVLVTALLVPARNAALEPRYDHRDQQGPTAEALVVKDFLWRGSTDATNALRGAVRVAWGFDPAGDGDELFVGAVVTTVDGAATGGDRVRLTFDARYRACLGTEELKTLLEVGLWVSAADRVAAGPLVGFGLIYDFSRDFGMLASVFLGAGIGQSRIVSFGGGIGAQYRFE
jgi:hypothetical protein